MIVFIVKLIVFIINVLGVLLLSGCLVNALSYLEEMKKEIALLTMIILFFIGNCIFTFPF